VLWCFNIVISGFVFLFLCSIFMYVPYMFIAYYLLFVRTNAYVYIL
jgi:hypothetical protein